jgi:lipoyl-dependent peroxiredoxin
MTVRKGSARYEGLGREGKGHVSTASGVLSDVQYGFASRFENGAGTNPEELLAAAHASCFTMALSFQLAGAGFTEGTLETEAAVAIERDGDGFSITRSDLTLTAHVPGIEPVQFEELAGKAKAGCPLSKVLKAEITLKHTLNGAG